VQDRLLSRKLAIASETGDAGRRADDQRCPMPWGGKRPMSRSALLITAAIFAALLLAADLGPADERNDRHSILDAYAAYDDAMQRKDSDALARCASDFTEIGTDGQVKTLGQVAEETKRLYHVSRAIGQRSTVDATWFNGDTAAALVDTRLVAEVNDPRAPGVWAPVVVVERSQDTWERRGYDWQLVSSRILERRARVGQIHVERDVPPAAGPYGADNQAMTQMLLSLGQQRRQVASRIDSVFLCAVLGCGAP
jgi:hypothetical protein